MSIPPIGSVLTLECQGNVSGPRFLDGRTMDGTVGLAVNPDLSGTQWALTSHAHDIVTLKCMGDVEGPRFLDGRTIDGTIGLSPDPMLPYSGTRWAVGQRNDGTVTFRCLGLADGHRFLDGRTIDGTVGLAADTGNALTGTGWRIRVTGTLTMIFCLGNIEGGRFLDGRTSEASVGLAPTMADPFSGTLWQMMGPDDACTLKCLGTAAGPQYLDGDTVSGVARLAPHTGAPYSGTLWQKVDLATGGSALRCLGAVDGVRFLDGRTRDGTVALIASPDADHTGSRWRLLLPCPPSLTLSPAAAAPVTVRIAQLTGSNDAEDKPVLNDTKAWGAGGLDLGANCEHSDGKLYLFLSDAVTRGNDGGPKWDSDVVAWIDAPTLGGHEAAGYDFVLPFEPASLPGQPEWRFCRNCFSLFFDGDIDKGVCPAGGGHLSAGARFIVPYEPTNVAGQSDWRRCAKCQGMFFELYPDRGVCSAGGIHVASGYRYVLPHGDFAGSRQANWRFCQWCRGLFFDGDADHNGECIAGGTAFRLHPVMDGKYFDPFKVAGSIQETLNAETVTGAFSYDERIYAFIWVGKPRDPAHPAGSYLVSKASPNHAGPYDEEFLFSPLASQKGFWQVAPWCVKNVDYRGLPSHEGDGLLMFAAGRDSDQADAVHLAWMPLRTRHEALSTGVRPGPQRDGICYFTNDPRPDRRWSMNATDAVALFSLHPRYTSLSATWLKGPQRWILLYSKANDALLGQDYAPTASVVARIGTTPWDWSGEIEIFNPCREQAYGGYMHWPGFDAIHPKVEPELNNEAAWPYGAFLLDRFTGWDASTRTLRLFYLLSLHRPYQAQVMFTKLRIP